MPTLTLPNAGQALIAFQKAKAHAMERTNQLANCPTCDKQKAEQWARDVELFESLIQQLQGE